MSNSLQLSTINLDAYAFLEFFYTPHKSLEWVKVDGLVKQNIYEKLLKSDKA